MLKYFFLAVSFYFFAITSYTQSWNGRVEVLKNAKGETVDSVNIFDWPASPPSYLHDKLDFRFFNKTRLHNNRIDLKYMGTYKSHTEMTHLERYYWRGNFAVYKSTSGELSTAKLYKYGIGMGTLKFPVNTDGHYLVLIIWGGDKSIAKNEGQGRMIYCVVQDGYVSLYDATECD